MSVLGPSNHSRRHGLRFADVIRWSDANVMLRSLSVLLLFSSCSHFRRGPIVLQDRLLLETTAAPTVVKAGDTIEATYTLRNTSDSPLDLCSPSGVSIMLKSESPPYIWPMYLYGITTDVRCSGPIHLSPRGAATFKERGIVRRNLPESEPLLIGRLSVWCDASQTCTEASLESSVRIKVLPTSN